VGVNEESFVGVIHSGEGGAVSRIGLKIIQFITSSLCGGLAIFGSDGLLVSSAKAKGICCRVAQHNGFGSGIFRDAVNAAKAELQDLRPAVLYANSVAASAWAVAGKQLGWKVIIHVYELDSELMMLLHAGVTCIDVCAVADGVVVSGEGVVSSLRRCLGYVPDVVVDAGVLFDDSEIGKRAKEEVCAPWLFGRRYVRSTRKLITMWGKACFRNGIDIFVEMAQALPEHDFLWIGTWTEDADHTLSANRVAADNLFNFFCTGKIDNPYPFIAMCDLFTLTARQTKNPTDLAELTVLNTPMVCFSASLDNWMVLPGAFYVLHGAPSVDRLIGFVSLAFAEDRIRAVIGPNPLLKHDTQAGLARLFEAMRTRNFW